MVNKPILHELWMKTTLTDCTENSGSSNRFICPLRACLVWSDVYPYDCMTPLLLYCHGVSDSHSKRQCVARYAELDIFLVLNYALRYSDQMELDREEISASLVPQLKH